MSENSDLGLAPAAKVGWTMGVNSTETALRMGFATGELVLEIGQDEDCDQDLRMAIEALLGTTLLTSDSDEVFDALILWFREGDGDLVDELVDGITYLSDAGSIWLMVPKVGLAGHVDSSDIQDAAPNAGLTQTVTFLAGANWTATRLVARKSNPKR